MRYQVPWPAIKAFRSWVIARGRGHQHPAMATQLVFLLYCIHAAILWSNKVIYKQELRYTVSHKNVPLCFRLAYNCGVSWSIFTLLHCRYQWK